MLDYGTGSGILGISACKFGCKSVIGIDIDDEAIEDAGQNIIRNGLSDQVIFALPLPSCRDIICR